jgi:hypothetical protein
VSGQPKRSSQKPLTDCACENTCGSPCAPCKGMISGNDLLCDSCRNYGWMAHCHRDTGLAMVIAHLNFVKDMLREEEE